MGEFVEVTSFLQFLTFLSHKKTECTLISISRNITSFQLTRAGPYYIDTSVLLQNPPIVKFIRNYIRDPSGVFSISSQVRILMTSLLAFSRLFLQAVGEKWRAICV